MNPLSIARKCYSVLVMGAAILCVLFFQGCSNEPRWQADMNEYAKRIMNVLDAQQVTLDWDVAPLFYPSRRELLLPLPSSSISLIDFLRLSQCDLQRLIGQRNSSLGKLQKSSTELFYSAQFIVLAKECVEQGELSEDLKQAIQQAILEKVHALPILMWNATFASQEFQQLHSVSGEAYSGVELPSLLQEALLQIKDAHDAMATTNNKSVLRAAYSSQNTLKDYELALATVTSTHYVGSLVMTTKKLTHSLSQLQKPLSLAWQERSFCIRGNNGALLLSDQDKQALRYVFLNYYINGVQQLMANVKRQWLQWQVIADSIEAERPIPNSYLEYKEKQMILVETLDDQIGWHTRFWQGALSDCNLAPS